MPTTPNSVLALDVGSKRVGVAVASMQARLPRPLITLDWNDSFFAALAKIVEEEAAGALIVGFPRGMQGQHTEQTTAVEKFAAVLGEHFTIPVYLQDESLTSVHAEEELQARGQDFDRGDVDSLAATYILEDWLNENS
jgi:putative Holliday junction resolvase